MHVILILFVILVLLLVSPILLLWCINSFAEAAGVALYIEHTLWNYWVAFVFLMLVRGTNYNSSK